MENGLGVRLRVRLANHWWQRARGLLGRPRPAMGEGLVLVPCRAIHTVAMSYPIDVVFIGFTGRIMSISPNLHPWNQSRCRDAYAVLELRSGEVDRLGLKVGQFLQVSDKKKEMRDV